MNQPNCSRCRSVNFAATNVRLDGVAAPVTFIHCAECGQVINAEFLSENLYEAVMRDMPGYEDI